MRIWSIKNIQNILPHIGVYKYASLTFNDLEYLRYPRSSTLFLKVNFNNSLKDSFQPNDFHLSPHFGRLKKLTQFRHNSSYYHTFNISLYYCEGTDIVTPFFAVIISLPFSNIRVVLF